MKDKVSYLLVLDNCFASKRWVEPVEWMQIAADCGIRYVEASADTECDSLYSDAAYLKDWLGNVRSASRKTGVKIANLYSGHGTYTTLGLAHPDERNARRMLDLWLGGMLNRAAELQCGVGFYCHAFSQSVLQSPAEYESAWNRLCEHLTELAVHARNLGVPEISLEQMYSPHQVPWRICDARRLLQEVKQRSGCDFYLTIDTGHQTGQHKFFRPDEETLERISVEYRRTGNFGSVWLGPEKAYEMVKHGETVSRIQGVLSEYDYLFAEPCDAEPYAWLEALGQYAPIIHLQQTDGFHSEHQPFDSEHNQTGIIKAEKLLEALKRGDGRNAALDMPHPCRRHALTLELFGGTAELPHEIIGKVKTSAAYWRAFTES